MRLPTSMTQASEVGRGGPSTSQVAKGRELRVVGLDDVASGYWRYRE
jgi:hypothetical protein